MQDVDDASTDNESPNGASNIRQLHGRQALLPVQIKNAIRPAVVNRKVCGGNRGWYSAETQQILMTLFRTAYQQGGDAVAIMIDLLRSPQPTIAPLAMPLTGRPDP